MTCWANVVHCIGYGPAGVVISGWPPVALIAGVEVLARMVRPSGQTAPPVPASENAATAAYRASVASGSPLSARQLAARMASAGARRARSWPR